MTVSGIWPRPKLPRRLLQMLLLVWLSLPLQRPIEIELVFPYAEHAIHVWDRNEQVALVTIGGQTVSMMAEAAAAAPAGNDVVDEVAGAGDTVEMLEFQGRKQMGTGDGGVIHCCDVVIVVPDCSFIALTRSPLVETNLTFFVTSWALSAVC